MNRSTTAALALLLVSLAIPTCIDDTGMYGRKRGPAADNGWHRGPGWKQQEHGDPLVGPGPKNPNGKDNRPGAR